MAFVQLSHEHFHVYALVFYGRVQKFTHPCCSLCVQLQRRHEQMKKNLEAQHKELEERRRQFEEERVSWETQQRILEQQKLDASRSAHHITSRQHAFNKLIQTLEGSLKILVSF